MSAALAFAAACCAVLAARDLAAGAFAGLRAALASRGPGWLRVVGGTVGTVIRAGREGRDPGAAERRRLLVGGGVVAFAGGFVAFGPLAGLGLAAAGPPAVGRVLAARRRRYRAAVDAGVPEMAVAIADALSGGCSLRSAVGEAAGGVGGAAGHELRRSAAELAAGAPTDDALEAMRRRARSPGMDTLVAACLLQRRAGGDLARLLRDSARALEDQARLEDEVRAATAQARFTALIVVLLPLGGGLLAELASPGWFAGLWSSFLTAWLVGIALILQAVAAVLMNRVARVRW
ncbi:MAG TPA: type II secretion system F family protein [Thermoleophilaceae bacterium]